MAVKTITIDMEAYETLVRARRGNESFSTVIKKTLGPASHTASGLLRHLDEFVMDEQVLESMDQVIASREDDWIAAEQPPGTEVE